LATTSYAIYKRGLNGFIRLDNNACPLCTLKKGLDFETHKKTNNLIMLSAKSGL
jgi:hypothetical protein